MKRFRLAVIMAAGLASTAMFSMPAAAQGVVAGAGAVEGTVNLSPGFAFGAPCGVPEPGLCNQSFTFGTTTLLGAFVGAGAPTGVNVATLSASASGGSNSACGQGAENVAGGVGFVCSVSATGTDTCEGICVFPPNVCIGSCTTSDQVTLGASGCGAAVCVGVFVRVGPVVAVVLTGTLTVTCTSGACSGQSVTYNPVVVTVEALFLPNQTPPATVTSAAFDGAFELAGVSA